MPKLQSDDEQALEWVAGNRDHNPEKASKVMEKLGLDSYDVDAWEFVSNNPNYPKAVDIRNKIFTKMTEGLMPLDKSKGYPAIDRIAIKNLADEGDVKTISSYLKSRGLVTRIKEGQLEAREPENDFYVRIEPTDIDKFDFAGWAKEAALDVTDVGKELIDMGVVTFATGSKVIGTTLFGLPGLAATSAASALAEASVEAGKQALAYKLGLIPKLEPDKVRVAGEDGFLIPGVTGLTGKVLEGFGAVLGKIANKIGGVKLKPNASEIIKQTESLGGGAKATPGQIFEDPGIIKLEESIVKSGDYQMSGLVTGLPKQVQTNKKAAIEKAQNLVKNRSHREDYDAGFKVGELLVKETEKKLEPAEKLYNEVVDALGGVWANKRALLDGIKRSKEKMKYSDDAIAFIKRFEKKINTVKSLKDLKEFRTQILKDVKPGDSSNVKIAANELYAAATEVRKESVLIAMRDLRGRFLPGQEKILLTKIKQADAFYRNAAEDVRKALVGRGKKLKTSPRQTVKDFVIEQKEIDRINEIIKTEDPRKIQHVRKAFPETFEVLRKQKIEQIAQKAEINGVVDPKRLAQAITNLPLRTQILFFGAKGTRDAKALISYLNSLPAPFNTSNTKNAIEFSKILNPLAQASSLGQGLLMDIIANTQLGTSWIQKTGKGLSSPLLKGGLTGGRNLILPIDKTNSEDDEE